MSAPAIHIHWSRGYWVPSGHRWVTWCFHCRTYALHWSMWFIDTSGWYEPNGAWWCVYCGKDYTVFPGCE